jgi:hypothetical protein
MGWANLLEIAVWYVLGKCGMLLPHSMAAHCYKKRLQR